MKTLSNIWMKFSVDADRYLEIEEYRKSLGLSQSAFGRLAAIEMMRNETQEKKPNPCTNNTSAYRKQRSPVCGQKRCLATGFKVRYNT